MSPDEVQARLGSPHQIDERNPQRVWWLYWLDAVEMDWYMVSFGLDGKVVSTGGS